MKGCRSYTVTELQKIIDYKNGKYTNRDKCLILLGIATGLRISELLSLTVEDVSNNGNINKNIYLKKSNVKNKIEGYSLSIPEYARDIIYDYLTDRENATPNEPLFLSRKGDKAITRIQAYRIINDVSSKLGIEGKIGTHTLRKTFARRVYELTKGNYFKCQKALRHKSLNSTVSYISIEEEELQKEIANMELF